ncbi:MAG TPA: response regulator [Stellaceae bacterium]|nr:response regulator [Stellaceae bacterium]
MSQLVPTDAREKSTVVIVDDDPSVRKAIGNLCESVGLSVYAFSSTAEFLSWCVPDTPVCMVLDVRMPGENGLDFQLGLSRSHAEISVVFITAHGDIPMSVRAMKAGAVEFLTKPFKDQDLLDAINAGLAKSRIRRAELNADAALRTRYESLSPREREVMDLITKGQLTKQIAARLRLSEITVKVCRGQLMRKMQTNSLPELGRMSERLDRMRSGSG